LAIDFLKNDDGFNSEYTRFIWWLTRSRRAANKTIHAEHMSWSFQTPAPVKNSRRLQPNR
jgi:hypothetical protein